jgi:alcohol-forming fatty acyl-CoA reductase
LYRLKIFGIKKETFRAWTMQQIGRLFASIDATALSQFLDSLYVATKPYLHPGIKRQIKKDKQAGYQIVLMSGNYDIFLERFRSLGFDVIIGTSLFNENGEYINNPEIIISERKPLEVTKRLPEIDWHYAKAYADAIYDLPLLSIVGQPIVVTPDKKLAILAKQNHWRIIK